MEITLLLRDLANLGVNVTFEADTFEGNTLTIYYKALKPIFSYSFQGKYVETDNTHTHIGVPDGDERLLHEQLVRELSSTLELARKA